MGKKKAKEPETPAKDEVGIFEVFFHQKWTRNWLMAVREESDFLKLHPSKLHMFYGEGLVQCGDIFMKHLYFVELYRMITSWEVFK